jgi:hypothetical protein
VFIASQYFFFALFNNTNSVLKVSSTISGCAAHSPAPDYWQTHTICSATPIRPKIINNLDSSGSKTFLTKSKMVAI